jgi:mRNA interferase MazF
VTRGEVWEVNLDPTIGSEIRKTRPCIIVNRDSFARLPLRIVVPLTVWDDRYETAPWHAPVDATSSNGLTKKSTADTFQVRSIATSRFVRRIGQISAAAMQSIEEALVMCMGLK